LSLLIAAVTKWDLEYFLERIPRVGDINISIFERAFAHNSAKLEKFSMWESLAQMRQRSLLALAETDERYNIVDWNFAFTNPELLKDYTVPKFFDMDLSASLGFSDHALSWIYFGEQGTGSPSHVDVVNTSAWLLLAKGRKHWRFVHSEQANRCGNTGNWADLFAPDLDQFSMMDTIEGWDLVQSPGEIVWVPSQCLHAVRNISSTIAVTHNYVDLTNLGEVYHAMCMQDDPGTARKAIDIEQLITIAAEDLRNQGFGDQLERLLPNIKKSLLAKNSQVEVIEDQIIKSLERISTLEGAG
jgi:hypothetical protein